MKPRPSVLSKTKGHPKPERVARSGCGPPLRAAARKGLSERGERGSGSHEPRQ